MDEKLLQSIERTARTTVIIEIYGNLTLSEKIARLMLRRKEIAVEYLYLKNNDNEKIQLLHEFEIITNEIKTLIGL